MSEPFELGYEQTFVCEGAKVQSSSAPAQFWFPTLAYKLKFALVKIQPLCNSPPDPKSKRPQIGALGPYPEWRVAPLSTIPLRDFGAPGTSGKWHSAEQSQLNAILDSMHRSVG